VAPETVRRDFKTLEEHNRGRHDEPEHGFPSRGLIAGTKRVARWSRDAVCRSATRLAIRRDLLHRLPEVQVLDARGFATSMAEFADWADPRGSKRLLMEDHYRAARRRLGVLMDGDEPTGARWNFDAENRQPPPKGRRGGRGTSGSGIGVAEPWWPVEDDIDEQVRHDLDRWERAGDVRFIGRDGPRRFPATRQEAFTAFTHFVDRRLAAFGPFEDAMLSGDPWMAHSLVSAPLNLGLLDPLELVQRVESAHRAGDVPIASAEGFIRQVIGWRDYIWNLYWHLGPEYRRRNALHARQQIPGGLPNWTPTPRRPGACRRCWPGSATRRGHTTSRG